MAESTHTLKIKAVLDSSQVKAQLAGIQSGKGGIGESASSMMRLEQAISKLESTLNQLPNKVSQASSKSVDITASKITRLMATWALGKVSSSAAGYLNNAGYAKAGRVVGALSEMGQATATGALAGGPVGAAAGLIMGSLDVIFKTLGDSAKNAAEALERLRPAIEAQLGAESKYFDQRVTKDFISGAIERNDSESLQKAIAFEKNRALTAQENINRQDAQGGVVSEAGLKQRKEFFKQQQEAEQAIAQYEQALAQIEAQKQKAAEEELRAFEESQKAAKERAQQETRLNQSIQEQIDAYDRGEETEATKSLLKTNDFAAISRQKKSQEQIAQDQKAAYRDFLAQAQSANSIEGKEFYIGQAESAKANWLQAQQQADILGGYKMPEWMAGFSAFNESQRAGYEALDFEGENAIDDIVKDEVGKANKFLADIKRIANDILNNSKDKDTTATFG